jgi:squalene-hopene/tetraprenyl-beta-curcumene cyclase
LGFLRSGQRRDGSWPIDTDLATWLTTLAIKGLGNDIPADTQAALRRWLLDQQYRKRHPFTASPPGGWGWTNLPGAVPDADDTAGALLALRVLEPDGEPDEETRRAAEQGIVWLLNLMNRDGGIPTFCRGWGRLPFDASTPDVTVHALHAFLVWKGELSPRLDHRLDQALGRGFQYLADEQKPDGSWLPLWFGNDQVPGHGNPVYGTARVVLEYGEMVGLGWELPSEMWDRGVEWLRAQANEDGGWGGCRGVPSSIEETSLAVSALARSPEAAAAVAAGRLWLEKAYEKSPVPTPIGLYFASLWYSESRYPDLFALSALRPIDFCRRRGRV